MKLLKYGWSLFSFDLCDNKSYVFLWDNLKLVMGLILEQSHVFFLSINEQSYFVFEEN